MERTKITVERDVTVNALETRANHVKPDLLVISLPLSYKMTWLRDPVEKIITVNMGRSANNLIAL